MQNAPAISATRRDRVGSRYARRVRESGKLPAVVYGHGAQPLAIALDAHETLKHINNGEKVFTMKIEGESKDQTVLLKDLGFDYLGSNIIHADFARVDLNERVHTKVHVQLIGDAKGLKTAGNILMHPTTELVIECRVADIPDHVDVDISELDLGHSITAAEVKLPTADMKMITDPHAIVAQCVVQLEMKVEEAAVVGTEAAQPEVITAKKPEDEAAAGAAKPGAAPAKGAAPAAAKPAAPKK
ncbi:MAG: 50S ribosomal protein L25 [Phycisphaerales bacterium]